MEPTDLVSLRLSNSFLETVARYVESIPPQRYGVKFEVKKWKIHLLNVNKTQLIYFDFKCFKSVSSFTRAIADL